MWGRDGRLGLRVRRMIPQRLVRTVPEVTTDEVEEFWSAAAALHPGWEMVTLRDPLDPADFPVTSPFWARCTSGAQRAGLIRLEDLWWRGGIYVDSDVELYRSLEPLRRNVMFAAWEDVHTIPDAVIGAEARYPAIWRCLREAISALAEGAWMSGPGVLTRVLPGWGSVLLLPPESFYPYHYTEKHRRHEDHRSPATFGAHHWAGSWLTK